jgi:hypothetical protein
MNENPYGRHGPPYGPYFGKTLCPANHKLGSIQGWFENCQFCLHGWTEEWKGDHMEYRSKIPQITNHER